MRDELESRIDHRVAAAIVEFPVSIKRVDVDSSRTSQRERVGHTGYEGFREGGELRSGADGNARSKSIRDRCRVGNGRIHVAAADGDDDASMGPIG